MKKATAYILAALIGICSLSSCDKENGKVDSKLVGEWLLELQDVEFDYIEDDEDLYFPQEANGVTIIYHFHNTGQGWKEIDIMEDSHIVYVPYDRYHTLFKYTVSPGGKVDITFLDEDGNVGEESDELHFDGNTLIDTIDEETLVFTRATEDQIKKYQAEADAWYGGADNSSHSITGVGEGWTWAGEIAATAIDR